MALGWHSGPFTSFSGWILHRTENHFYTFVYLSCSDMAKPSPRSESRRGLCAHIIFICVSASCVLSYSVLSETRVHCRPLCHRRLEVFCHKQKREKEWEWEWDTRRVCSPLCPLWEWMKERKKGNCREPNLKTGRFWVDLVHVIYCQLRERQIVRKDINNKTGNSCTQTTYFLFSRCLIRSYLYGPSTRPQIIQRPCLILMHPSHWSTGTWHAWVHRQGTCCLWAKRSGRTSIQRYDSMHRKRIFVVAKLSAHGNPPRLIYLTYQ